MAVARCWEVKRQAEQRMGWASRGQRRVGVSSRWAGRGLVGELGQADSHRAPSGSPHQLVPKNKGSMIGEAGHLLVGTGFI